MKLSAQIVLALWAASALVQLFTCVLIARRNILKDWWLGCLGLGVNAGKSIVLMSIWWSFGFRAYSAAWAGTRWIHWVAVLLLLSQALWSLARVWPQGRPFAVMVAVFLVTLAGAAALLQVGWIEWPGRTGAAAIAGRTFTLGAFLLLLWIGWVYRLLRVITRNASLWRTGLLACLSIEAACFTVEALTGGRGTATVAAQIARQTAYMAAAAYWWRMDADGEAYTLPSASDMPDVSWRILERWMEGEKRRMAV